MYYVITKEQAEEIGIFYYQQNKCFNPFALKQHDGTFAINKNFLDSIKEHHALTSINVESLNTISELNNFYKP